MAEPARPALEWHERREPREWHAVAGPAGEYVLVVHYARDCPVSLVDLASGAAAAVAPRARLEALTAKAGLYRRRGGAVELMREGWADTIVDAKALAAGWLDRLRGSA